MHRLFVIATALLLISVYAKELVNVLWSLTVARLFGLYCKQVSFFGHTVYRNKRSDSWHTRRDKPSPLIQELTLIDLEKQVPDDIDSKDSLNSLLKALFNLCLSAGLIFWRLKSGGAERVLHSKGTLAELFLDWFAIGYTFHSLVSLGIFIYVYFVMSRRLMGHTMRAVNKLRAGYPFEDMELKPVRDLPYKNTTLVERTQYYQLYLCLLESSGRPEDMREPIGEIVQYLSGKSFIIQNMGLYCWLVYYFSRYELDPQSAGYYLGQIRAALEADRDANSKRVLAYYAFGIEQDYVRARSYWQQAMNTIDEFSLGAERELERKMLRELDEFLKKQGA